MQLDSVKALLKRPIAFHPIVAFIAGSVNSGLLLCQAMYWSERTQDKHGWFFKTQQEWHEETCLSRTEQETARRILRKKGFLKEERRGHPAKLFFCVNLEAIHTAILQYAGNLHTGVQENIKQDCRNPVNKVAGNLQTRLQESCRLDCRKPAYKIAGNLHTRLQESCILLKEAESTSESTSEKEKEKSGAPRLVLSSGNFFKIKKADFEEWKRLFPQVDVDLQLLAMEAYLRDNPGKRRDKDKMPAFITRWLQDKQDRGLGKKSKADSKAKGYKPDTVGLAVSPKQAAAASLPKCHECDDVGKIIIAFRKEKGHRKFEFQSPWTKGREQYQRACKHEVIFARCSCPAGNAFKEFTPISEIVAELRKAC